MSPIAPLNRHGLPAGFDLHRGVYAHLALAGLHENLALEQTTVRVFGRTYPTPRLTAWYGEASYTYSGIHHEPATMPSWLESLRDSVEKRTGATFNSVLANYYRDGRDSVSWHADDEPELGPEPTIASVSLGERRQFCVKPREGRGMWAVPLEHGDLLVMSGRSQADYLHSVPKLSRAVPYGPRLNLTFRVIE